MGGALLGLSVIVIGGGLVVAAWRPLRRLGHDIQVERARELFLLQRERLEDQFRQAAAATGKPRGLHWHHVQFEPSMEMARDRESRLLVALAPITIKFEAIEGGDMEGVAAVDLHKNASAVFFFQRGQWGTVGKTVFNLNPDEALRHFQQQYERIETAS